MNNNNLITSDERERELFNSQNFSEVEPDIDKEKYDYLIKDRFILYFMQFLQFAYINNMISDNRRNFVADTLIKRVNHLANNNIRILTNYLYIITLWLKNQTNYAAWNEIKSINTEKEADNFIEHACSWFTKKISEISERLKTTEKLVLQIGSQDLMQSFVFLNQSLNEVVNFSTSGINLKDLHFSDASPIFFSVKNINETEYFASLRKTIDVFEIEVKILYKVNARDFFKKKRGEVNKFKKSRKKSTNNPILDKSLDEWLAELKKEFEEKLESVKAQEESSANKLDELENQFALEHPELEGDEFDKAFDTFLESYFEENSYEEEFSDPLEIEEWYSNKKEEFIQEYADAEEEESQEESSKDEILLNSEIDSLENMIKEYAIFAFANQGRFDYPANIAERDQLMNTITLEEAIPEFLDAFSEKLSKEEIAYLEEAVIK